MAAIKKNSKVTFNKSGSGSLSGRITIPSEFLQALGLDPNNRDVEISYQYGKIIISKKNI